MSLDLNNFWREKDIKKRISLMETYVLPGYAELAIGCRMMCPNFIPLSYSCLFRSYKTKKIRINLFKNTSFCAIRLKLWTLLATYILHELYEFSSLKLGTVLHTSILHHLCKFRTIRYSSNNSVDYTHG